MQKETDTLKKENSELKVHIQNITCSKQQKAISKNEDKENKEMKVLLKSITEAQELFRLSVSLKNNFFSDKIKDIESTLEENMTNLDNNVRLGRDLEQSVNELWEILEKDENLHK